MFRKIIALLTVISMVVLGLPLAGCGAAGTATDRVTLQINWYHAPEFVGYYVAGAKGFYRDAGIEVTINEGGSSGEAWGFILDGRADFAVGTFEEQRKMVEAGDPSVAVMSVFQLPPLVMFALAGSGIKEPKDLIGKRVGIKSNYWRAIARETVTNAGIDPSKIVEVDVPADAQSMLYDGKVDVWMGYAHDEPVKARVAGYDVTTIYPADYGVGGYEGLLLANEATVAQKPDMVGRFVRASQQGFKYALEHPDEAAQIMTKWETKEGLDYQKLAVRALIPLVDTPQAEIGWIDAKRWEQLMGASYKADRPGYTMQFLQNK